MGDEPPDEPSWILDATDAIHVFPAPIPPPPRRYPLAMRSGASGAEDRCTIIAPRQHSFPSPCCSLSRPHAACVLCRLAGRRQDHRALDGQGARIVPLPSRAWACAGVLAEARWRSWLGAPRV